MLAESILYFLFLRISTQVHTAAEFHSFESKTSSSCDITQLVSAHFQGGHFVTTEGELKRRIVFFIVPNHEAVIMKRNIDIRKDVYAISYCQAARPFFQERARRMLLHPR